MRRLSKSHLNWAKGVKASVVWAEEKWRHSRNRLLEKLSCEGGWKLLIPCPACSFPSECAWSVMAAQCRENGQGSTLLELIAMFAVLTENGFWLLLVRVPCFILPTKKRRLMSVQGYWFHSPLFPTIFLPHAISNFVPAFYSSQAVLQSVFQGEIHKTSAALPPMVYSSVWGFAHCQ